MIPAKATIVTQARHPILDKVLFPIRALFMGPKGYWGLSSLKQERMRAVARLCRGRVLDVGCGPHNIFIRDYIGYDSGVGVDVFAYEGVELVIEDPLHLPFPDSSFDTVTLIAVGGHIPKHQRLAEFQELARVLRPKGRLVMTEGEPITQFLLHKWYHFYLGLYGMKDVDTERGMQPDEQFCMPRKELLALANTPPFHFVERRRFMWGLNNVYLIEKR